ncbi:hypothetical protein [Reichenbachiella ulvae]|uniref:PH domain-containing protein n=1 Tax=Reichenbachiella ulvae TaxID=2980104 RepID=A0ABT3CMZ2_9BACT|nr:hypothetical protein [Reichenbachiella ulvae]MCV9385070.1 hypothetical protein [Reichenbachiella ulvae]
MKKDYGNLIYHALLNSLPLLGIFFLIKKCIDEAEAIPFFIYCSFLILVLVITRLRMIESYCIDGNTITIKRIHNSESFQCTEIKEINYTKSGSIEVHLKNSKKHFLSSNNSKELPAFTEHIVELAPNLPSPKEVDVIVKQLSKKDKLLIVGLLTGLIVSFFLSF